MDVSEYHCYKLNRIFLLSIGLWPYGDSFFKHVRAILCNALLVSAVFVQLLKLFTTEYSFHLILTDLSLAIPFMAYFLKYNTHYVQPQKIRNIMKETQNNWNTIENEQEVEIIKKYAKFGNIYMYVFAGLVYPGSVTFIIVQLLPDILNVIAPLNESRPRIIPFITEYFLDEEKYFYLIFLHMNSALIVGVVTIVTTETLLSLYIYHSCSLFEVVSYRIEDALNERIPMQLNREDVTRMKLINAIEIHQRAIKFFDSVVSTFSICYFLLIFLGVSSLSLNLFRILQIIILPDEKRSFVIFFIVISFIFGHFYYMFIYNYIGQIVTDCSSDVCRKIYDTQWYASSVQTQKLLLFVMQRSTKTCKFIMGGIYSVSLENFSKLMSMSLSYFMVIYSVQQ